MARIKYFRSEGGLAQVIRSGPNVDEALSPGMMVMVKRERGTHFEYDGARHSLVLDDDILLTWPVGERPSQAELVI